jgi:hypothetical protein
VVDNADAGDAAARAEDVVDDAVAHAARHLSAELDAVYERERPLDALNRELDDEVRTTQTVLTCSVVVEHDVRSTANAIALELERAAALARPAWRGHDGRDRRVVSVLVTESDA